ncbi:MAG: glycosyltransferase family 4 protein [Myxococcales bacterium]|nr:glycosyltransferase family 4 protein [Myxococcales bacterium]
MKILHLINTLAAGGAEIHLLALCREMKRRGIEVIVAGMREKGLASRLLRPDFEALGIRVFSLGSNSRYDARFLPDLVDLVRAERPDILHSHLPRADLAAAWVRFRVRDVTWVSSVHDIHGSFWSSRWSLPLLKAAWRWPDRLIAISHAVRDWLIGEMRVPGDRVQAIHYGLEVSQVDRGIEDMRVKWKLVGRPIIGALARVEPRKGHDRLIRAMPAIVRRVPGSVLVIAGPDWEGHSAQLQALIDALGMRENVRLLGFQSDVASLLHSIDVFAFATHAEGFGLVLLEAMAASRPVVATRIAPLTEIVEDGVTGFLIDPNREEGFGERIADLLRSPERAREMGRRGRARVEETFTVHRMVDRTLAAYEEALRRSATRMRLRATG